MPFFATTDHTKLYYEIEGEGPPIVFLHGWNGSNKLFGGYINELSDKFCCISYCHRGHGASSTPNNGFTIGQLARDLKELMTYLHLKDVILVGHSMGAHTVYDYVSQFGCDNISRIVVLDMSPRGICDDNWKFGLLESYDEVQFKADRELLCQDVSQFMWKLLRQMMPEFAGMPVSLKPMIDPGLRGSNHTLTLLALWNSMFTQDYRPVMEKITVPLAYAIPSNPFYPMGAALYIKEHAKADVEIIEMPGTSHLSMVENVPKTGMGIVNYLRK